MLELKELTKEEFNEKIQNNDYNFSNFIIDGKEKYDLTLINNKEVKFSNSKISNLDFEKIKFVKVEFNGVSFEKCNFLDSSFLQTKFIDTKKHTEDVFKNVTFKNIDFLETTFENIKFEECDFSDSKFLRNTKFKNCDLSENIFDRILSSDKFDYLFEKCDLRLSRFYHTDVINEFNSEDLKNKGIIYDNLDQQRKILQEISDARFGKLSESFEKLKKNFFIGEIIWLLVIIFMFVFISIFIYCINTTTINNNNNNNNNNSNTTNNIDINYYFKNIPLIVIFSTFLYFSVSQYSTSKKLRIENQNKVALLHGMVGIKADTDKDMDKNIFYQNVANIVFSKVYEGKEENLPLDKVLELVKIINSNNKK